MSDVFAMFGPQAAVQVLVMPELPSDPRERFRVLAAHLKEVKSVARMEGLQVEFDAEIAALVDALPAATKKKAGKKPPFILLGQEKYDAVLEPYKARLQVMLDARTSETERVKTLLGETADAITIAPGEEWRKVSEVSSSSYNTQGYGAHSYARAAAEMQALHFEGFGLKAEIRTNRLRDRYPNDALFAKSDVTDYEVWVLASEEDCAIAEFKSGMNLKDWLQACWDRQRNPRVYNPHLPHGLEEKLGVQITRYRTASTG